MLRLSLVIILTVLCLILLKGMAESYTGALSFGIFITAIGLSFASYCAGLSRPGYSRDKLKAGVKYHVVHRDKLHPREVMPAGQITWLRTSTGENLMIIFNSEIPPDSFMVSKGQLVPC